MIAALLAAGALAPASPAPVVWQGVMLGEPTAAVVARLGPPASRRKAIMGTTLFDFEALDGQGTLSLTDAGGIVAGIRLIASDPGHIRRTARDPFGVALGDGADRLTELRGQPQRYDDEGEGEFTSYYGGPSDPRWTYGLRDGVVFSIGVIAPFRVQRASGAAAAVPTPRPSNAPTPPPADGSALDRAIPVTPEARDADPQLELSYVRRVSCAQGAYWSPLAETLVNARRRNFLRVDARCEPTGLTRAFYFDITAVFGRGER